MALSNTEKQSAFRQRMKEQGYVRREFWIKGDPIGRMERCYRMLGEWRKLPEDQRPPFWAMMDVMQACLCSALAELTGGGSNVLEKPEKRE